MKIEKNMNLDQLAERMGSDATREDAAIMCEFLLVGDDLDTADVDPQVWADCLGMVAEARAAE